MYRDSVRHFMSLYILTSTVISLFLSYDYLSTAILLNVTIYNNLHFAAGRLNRADEAVGNPIGLGVKVWIVAGGMSTWSGSVARRS